MLASLLYSIASLLVDLLSVRDREQAELQAEVLALRHRLRGCCNGRYADRAGVQAIAWSWRRSSNVFPRDAGWLYYLVQRRS